MTYMCPRCGDWTVVKYGLTGCCWKRVAVERTVERHAAQGDPVRGDSGGPAETLLPSAEQPRIPRYRMDA